MAEKKTDMETFQDARPLEREFKIVMAADSGDEVGVEIDTDIPSGARLAWAILGLRWSVEKVADGQPVAMGGPATTGIMFLQLVRGKLPQTPLVISRHDHDLIGEDMLEFYVGTNVGISPMTWPREVPFQGVTQLPTIHLTFGTVIDFIPISAVTNMVVGSIIYKLVSAPKARHEDL